MEEKLNRYVKGHMLNIFGAIMVCFIILFLGEFLLFRKIMHVNQMVAEGFFQLKQENKTVPTPTPTIVLKKK